MRFTSSLVLGVLAISGCGDDGGGSGADSDAAVDAADGALVFPRNGAALIAARDGDGAWQQLVVDAEQHAHLMVTSGRYQVVYACATGPSVLVQLQSATPATRPRDPTCVGPTGVIVRGAVHPSTVAAEIYAGTSFGPAMPDGTFAIITVSPTIDVAALALDAPVRLAIRRAIDATVDVSLDFATAPQLITSAIAVDGVVSGESAIPFVRLYTPNGLRADLAARDGSAHHVAAADLGAGDRQLAGARIIGTQGGSRSIQHTFTGTPPARVTAPPADTFTIGHGAITWQRTWTSASASLGATGGPGLTAQVTGAYLAAAGAAELPLVDLATLPGWMPAWGEITAGASVRYQIQVRQGDEDGDGEAADATGMITW